MKQPGKSLPPLDYLLAFESAARSQSFAGAARELNISESAISRKIRLLEQYYEIPLFLRTHRSVSLTPQGHAMFGKISPALDALRTASREMLSEHQKNTVTLAATNSVAALWLMPRLRRFNQSNKHLKIMLVASDNDQECLAENIDLAILRGDGNWPGFRARLLFGETVFPVCSPGYLEKNPKASDLAGLPECDLIGVSNAHVEWMNWPTWFAHKDVAISQTDQAVLFNTYPLAIQAAVDGLGMALGWGHLVDHLLEAGKLVRPVGRNDVRTNHGYFLLCSKKSPSFPERDIVQEWLLQESAKRQRYHTRAVITAAEQKPGR